jgi:hypothetical protein
MVFSAKPPLASVGMAVAFFMTSSGPHTPAQFVADQRREEVPRGIHGRPSRVRGSPKIGR